MDNQDFILIGKINGVFGVKGWVKVFSYTEPRENILQYNPLYIAIDGDWQQTKIVSRRRQGKGIVMAFDSIDTPADAQSLIGMSLAIKKSQLNAAQDEYFWSDLIDMVVINQQGVELGQVKGLIETGANDVLQVVNTNDKTEYLVPFVPEVIVLNVDKSAGRIDVDWQRDY